jgi:hypothetical protein
LIAFSLFTGSMMNAQSPTSAEVQEIAERAYIYAYPLVLLQTTTSIMPPNHLVHVSAFPDARFRLIVRPNADTLYTNAWIDVSKEPVLLHVVGGSEKRGHFGRIKGTSTVVTLWTFWEEAKVGDIVAARR